jgi:hypothetical protein
VVVKYEFKGDFRLPPPHWEAFFRLGHYAA